MRNILWQLIFVKGLADITTTKQKHDVEPCAINAEHNTDNLVANNGGEIVLAVGSEQTPATQTFQFTTLPR